MDPSKHKIAANVNVTLPLMAVTIGGDNDGLAVNWQHSGRPAGLLPACGQSSSLRLEFCQCSPNERADAAGIAKKLLHFLYLQSKP